MRKIQQTFCYLFSATLLFQINIKATNNIERSVHWTTSENGEQYAGLHILAEFWGVKPETFKNLNTEGILAEAALQADATPLEIITHKFEAPNNKLPPGITGAVILEESHITIHTWLEENYVAVDAFTCGPRLKPHKAIEYLKEKLQPTKVEIQEIKRGKKEEAFEISVSPNNDTGYTQLTFDPKDGPVNISKMLRNLIKKENSPPEPLVLTQKTTQQEIDQWMQKIKEYKEKTYKHSEIFGEELSIDLYDCDNEIISSKEKIAQYSEQLCDLIDMKRYGNPFIEHFAEHSKFAAGYSLAQMIETSLISGHFSEYWDNAYINIFSCKDFDAQKALMFTMDFFGAKKARVILNIR